MKKVILLMLFLLFFYKVSAQSTTEYKSLIVQSPMDYPYGVNINMIQGVVSPRWAREFNFSYNGAGNLFSFGAVANNNQLEYGYIHGNSSKNLVNHIDPWMTFLPDGKIGIGKTTPTARLDVNGDIKGNKLDINGTIRSKEVKIEATGWSDFVFGEDYKLPTLSEVESHIKEHKHLPDVPSEKQVIEEGVNVVEMQAKLLQKIEELTLYVIEQDKKILKQDRKIKQLEEKFNGE